MVRFRILGPLEAETAEGPITLRGRRQRAVLALLLTSDGPVPAERAVVEVWGEDAPPETVKTLRSVVSRLRRQLGAEVIRTVPAGYVIEIERGHLDADRFRDLVEESRLATADGDISRAAGLLREATALWSGEPLSDLQDLDFARLEAARLTEMRFAALIDLAGHELALGRHREVVADLAALVESDPYREELWRLLVTALYRSDRQADALRAFDRCVEALSEVGLEPSSELRRLASAVASHDPALDVPATPDAPPTGTVTLLFVDVADSTHLWAEDPDRMATAVRRHDALVASALRDHGGHVFAMRGDSHAAAFAQPDGAVAAAVAIQQTAAPTEDAPGVAPRVAINTGEVPAGSGHYRGPVVERTLRLLEAAHGGQIVLSSSTREMLDRRPPAGTTFKDLGDHRLFDLSQPERVFQLTVQGLPDRFPPLDTLGGRPNNLPVQLTSFVGRSREVGQVAGLLASRRLVTLVGPGGAGKSRLALHTAARLLEDSRAGTWFVELATVDRPEQVIPEIAETFAVRDMETESGRSLLDVLVDHIAHRDMLLVLDNCEHVLTAAADAARTLLERCSGLSIMATSREPLGVPGETLFKVPPLGLPDTDDVGAERSEAVRLFAERAAESRAGFTVTGDNRPAVAELVRRLDGLPLAIELAASRTNVLGPAEILERLADRFGVLSGPVGRHETLRAALDWSHGMLDEAEQALFRRLAVFSGGWTLADAEVVCAYPPIASDDVLDLMAGLVDKSLVEPTERDGATRYRLLETIKEYAAERLVETEPTSEAWRRHAERYLALATEGDAALRSKDQGAWVRRLEAEHDNMRAAIDWATVSGHGELALRLVGALGWFWWIRGYWKEAMQRLGVVLEATPDADPVLRAKTVCRVARIEAMRVRPKEVAPLIAEARETLSATEDSHALAWATLLYGETAPLVGDTIDWDRAISLLDESVRLFEDASDPWGAALARYSVALARGQQGEDTSPGVRAAIGEMERLGDRWTASWLSFNLGSLLAARGDLDRARSAVGRSLELARGTGDVWVEPHALSRRAIVDAMSGEPRRAVDAFDAVLPRLQQIGDENCTAMSWLYRGEALGSMGDAAESRRSLRDALRIYRDMSHAVGTARTLLRVARLAATEGDLETAARALGATDKLVGRIGEETLNVFDRRALAEAEEAVTTGLETDRRQELLREGARLDPSELIGLVGA